MLLPAQLRINILQRVEQHAAVFVLAQRMPQLASVKHGQVLQRVAAATVK